jgi:hypothetical protein
MEPSGCNRWQPLESDRAGSVERHELNDDLAHLVEPPN